MKVLLRFLLQCGFCVTCCTESIFKSIWLNDTPIALSQLQPYSFALSEHETFSSWKFLSLFWQTPVFKHWGFLSKSEQWSAVCHLIKIGLVWNTMSVYWNHMAYEFPHLRQRKVVLVLKLWMWKLCIFCIRYFAQHLNRVSNPTVSIENLAISEISIPLYSPSQHIDIKFILLVWWGFL